MKSNTIVRLLVLTFLPSLFPSGSAQAGFFDGPERIIPGVRFVAVEVGDESIPSFSASIHEVTNRQYSSFLESVGRGSDPWFDTYGSEPGDLPARGMKKKDAIDYVKWATWHCRQLGLIGENERINLPTDQQYTVMFGQLPSAETGSNPSERMKQSRSGSFIHGIEEIPNNTYGNLLRELDAGAKGLGGFAGGSDGYFKVCPVGKFQTPGSLLFDLLGNVREMTRESFSPGGADCVRGGSYNTKSLAEIAISYRESFPSGSFDDTTGFRLVIEKDLAN